MNDYISREMAIEAITGFSELFPKASENIFETFTSFIYRCFVEVVKEVPAIFRTV